MPVTTKFTVVGMLHHPGKPKPFVPLTIVADPDHESGFIVIMGNQQIVGKINKASQTAKLMEIIVAQSATQSAKPRHRIQQIEVCASHMNEAAHPRCKRQKPHDFVIFYFFECESVRF